MALTSISYTVNFDLDQDSATAGKFVIEDTTDYAGQGIDPADVVVWFDITAPQNTWSYTGSSATPDILPDVSTTWDTEGIPLDADLEYIEGLYTFKMYVEVSAPSPLPSPNPLTTTGTFTFCRTSPEEPDIEYEVNCFCTQITIEDATVYGTPTTSSRTMSLFPPASLGLATQTTNAATLTYTFSYTGAYYATVDTLLTYVTGVYTVTERVKSEGAGTKVSVICDIDLCGLNQCLRRFYDKVEAEARRGGLIQEINQAMFSDYQKILMLINLFKSNLECGKGELASENYDDIKEVLQRYVQCDCGCVDDETPTLVNPYCGDGGSGNTVVVAANAPITVASVTVGQTTTYTVSISQTWIDNMNNLLADVATLQGDVTTLQGDVTTLQSDVTTLQDDILNQIVHVATPAFLTNSGVLADTDSYNIPAGTYTNGTLWEGAYYYDKNTATSTNAVCNLIVNGTTLFTSVSAYDTMPANQLTTIFQIQKITNTSVSVWWRYSYNATGNQTVTAYEFKTTLVVADMTANVLNVKTQAACNTSSAFEFTGGTIKQFNVA